MSGINYAAIQKAIDRQKRAIKTNLFQVFPVYSEDAEVSEDKIKAFDANVISFRVSNRYIDVYVNKHNIKYDKGIKDEGLYDYKENQIEGFTLDLLTEYGGVWKRVHLKGRWLNDEKREIKEKLREKFPNIDTNKEEILYDCSYVDQDKINKDNYYHFMYEFYEQTYEMEDYIKD